MILQASSRKNFFVDESLFIVCDQRNIIKLRLVLKIFEGVAAVKSFTCETCLAAMNYTCENAFLQIYM